MPGGKSNEVVNCQYCKGKFNIRGIHRHEKSCKTQKEREARDLEYEHAVAAQRAQQDIRRDDAQILPPLIIRGGSSTLRQGEVVVSQSQDVGVEQEDTQIPTPSDPTDTQPTTSTKSNLEEDSIRIDFHPHSGKPTQIMTFEEYSQTFNNDSSPPIPEGNVFRPFCTRGDFEFADLALNASLSNDQIDAFLKLFHDVKSGLCDITFKDHVDLSKTWEHAANLKTHWVKEDIHPEYTDTDIRTYEVWHRPIWDWTLDLLSDPILQSEFVWDAQRLFKYNDNHWTRFYDEPWTGDRWWEMQTTLPPNGKPVCYILYIDKSRLSSFGTAKAYPVIARLANLRTKIRNGRGIGRGQFVGWFPIVSEDANEEGKPRWTNFKRIVWHSSFMVVFQIIAKYSKLGYPWELIQRIISYLFPMILIFSADFEERCTVALTRGATSNFPCPICLVPAEMLMNLLQDYPIRTALSAEAIVKQARILTQDSAEKLLKSYGLRDIDNGLWALCRSDPHAALSFDRLHAHESGLFADHILKEIKVRLNEIGNREIGRVTEQLRALPCWSGLNHFESALSVSFADGTKWEDISKILLFGCHNIITERTSPEGYLLLKCLRSYLNLTMYLSLKLQTEDTIASGEQELLQYSTLIQITQIDHYFLVAATIRQDLELQDSYNDLLRHRKAEDSELTDQFQRIHIGSKEKPITLQGLLESHQNDAAFATFRALLSAFLNDFFMQYDIPLPNGNRIMLKPEQKIVEYHLLKIFYESYEDWHLKCDVLRCSPKFHNEERYDHILVDGAERNFFARLILVFTIKLDNNDYPLALIQPLDRSTGVMRRKDKDLGLYRIGA
ncbi:hypothetical protein QCA50_014546 [Cerrena zonata]|uniref:Uncharacterized protein n=1 Tax=Cerrena zonata TaxID=2478898 RepID=A0AAW0FNS7_9APHY